MSIEDILKSIRNELKLSQEQLARDIDVSHATLNRWENGHNAPSRLAKKELARYCKKKAFQKKLLPSYIAHNFNNKRRRFRWQSLTLTTTGALRI